VSENLVTTRPDPASRAAAEATVCEPATPKDLLFEAQRQLIALAEALARQAAHEDDAAERLAERSRSPPGVPVEILPGGGGKEDTS
jgi:hypothetical protein